MLTRGIRTRLKDAENLRAIFAAAGVDPAAGPLVLSCGTGVTACGVRLGLAAAFPQFQQVGSCCRGDARELLYRLRLIFTATTFLW